MQEVPDKHRIQCWTDGSVYPNPGGIGGWAFLIRYPNGREVTNYGCHRETTNNRMEMQAVISCLAALPYLCDPIVFSDSKYVIEGSGKRHRKTERLDAGGSVKNSDLWLELFQQIDRVGVPSMRWVRGHSGQPENERVDFIAGKAREQMQERMLSAYDPVHVRHLREIVQGVR